MKRGLKIVSGFVAVLLIILGIYITYLFLDYDRLPDQQEITTIKGTNVSEQTEKAQYRATSFNIGYAAYPADYSFFMDGGKYSRAYDKETVLTNLDGISTALTTLQSDIIFLQEVDTIAHRSFKVNQVDYLTDQFSNYDAAFAQNYDSSYLFYPFTKPIGQSTSGLLTLSQFPIVTTTRYSLPIETDFNKFFDLDRAFSVSHTTLGEHPLTLINVHLSAFTEDTTILDNQIKKLAAIMEAEYQSGRSVIVGGDFNHDLLGNSPEVFETKKIIETWTHPFPEEFLSENFTVVKKDLVEAKIPTVRANGTGYTPGESFVSLIDGFIVSHDIIVETTQVTDLGFANSDHNPITLTFQFKEE
ncbi:MAG: endonuclease/exonuclease/phosphatase family protein [Enterococcus aquimarinus]|uniref:Endonuclease/exonuclease/phosphatase family protein n=1 Tax=Enterococcus aquimarinus TaxID=328396 RepID=A0A9E4DRK0_9ENTE|nr:endonuclease/exonuclease/phosphatase family protein [Enterococcus aquimarinus]